MLTYQKVGLNRFQWVCVELFLKAKGSQLLVFEHISELGL